MSETTQASAETPEASYGSSEEAQNAFMSQWESAEKPDEPEVKGDAETADEVRAAEEVPDQEPQQTETDLHDDDEYEYVTVEVDEDGTETVIEDAKPSLANDEMITKVKVGDKEIEASVKDLKRLYGQEKALTQKSQEVASQRKAIEDQALQYEASLTKLMERAQERYKPYAEVDMLMAAKTMNDDDFMQLRKEAQSAQEDLAFFTQEAQQYATQVKEQQQAEQKEKAIAAVKVLQETVPDWSPELYGNMRQYAVSQGLSAEVVDQIVEPAAIQLMIKAMRYDQGKTVSTQKKVRRQKRVLKSGTSNTTATQKQRQNTAMANLVKSGSHDDAAAAFMSRWQQ